MINLFRKLLTGYTTVTKTFNGKDYRFIYSGKPVFFDPIQIVQEGKRRLMEAKVRKFSAPHTLDSLDGFFPKKDNSILPTVVCSFKEKKGDYTVSRYVFKEGNYPVSHYVFEKNKTVMGVFFRIHDYGYLTQKYTLAIDPDLGQAEADLCSWKWESEGSTWTMIEKFGHTQIWCWNGALEI